VSVRPVPPARSVPDRRLASVRRAVAVALAAAAAGCTAADNLSSAEILAEIDQIVSIEGSGDATEIAYAPRARVAAWYVKSVMTQPLRWPLVWVFGHTGEVALDNPARHVRELMVELPDEVGGDLLVGAVAASRLAWIVEFERTAQNRLVALDGLAAIAIDLGLELFRGDFGRFDAPVDAERVAAARAGVQAGRPASRGTAPQDAARLQPYGDALARLTAAPLPDRVERLRLLEEVTALYADETDGSIRPAVGAALRAAIGHVVEGALLRIVAGRAHEQVDLRLCAMEQVRRLGGPAAVPLLLAKMAASPTQTAAGEPRYDPHPHVRLRLIHYCGQLRPPLADTAVELTGRKGWLVDSPADFLAYTVLSETAHYSKLRTPALVALTWSLQRPRVDADVAWVSEWRERRR
jgi:hypothetical protein